MIAAVADTHTSLWHLFDDKRLSAEANRFIDDAAAARRKISSRRACRPSRVIMSPTTAVNTGACRVPRKFSRIGARDRTLGSCRRNSSTAAQASRSSPILAGTPASENSAKAGR